MPNAVAISVTPSWGDDELANNRRMSEARSTVVAELPPAPARCVAIVELCLSVGANVRNRRWWRQDEIRRHHRRF
jgi:hypothetical protein